MNCDVIADCSPEGSLGKFFTVLRYSLHTILDAPLPVGLMHSYMTALEERMNKLVVRLSGQFLVVDESTRSGSALPT